MVVHANGRPLIQLNFMVVTRPSKYEVDALEELGNPGWNWDTLLPYFKKVPYYRTRTCYRYLLTISRRIIQSEDFQLPDVGQEHAQKYAATPDTAYHGTNGQSIPVTHSRVSN